MSLMFAGQIKRKYIEIGLVILLRLVNLTSGALFLRNVSILVISEWIIVICGVSLKLNVQPEPLLPGLPTQKNSEYLGFGLTL